MPRTKSPVTREGNDRIHVLPVAGGTEPRNDLSCTVEPPPFIPALDTTPARPLTALLPQQRRFGETLAGVAVGARRLSLAHPSNSVTGSTETGRPPWPRRIP
jgi:hypothetical protein